jgi:hypothetical protein
MSVSFSVAPLLLVFMISLSVLAVWANDQMMSKSS